MSLQAPSVSALPDRAVSWSFVFMTEAWEICSNKTIHTRVYALRSMYVETWKCQGVRTWVEWIDAAVVQREGCLTALPGR